MVLWLQLLATTNLLSVGREAIKSPGRSKASQYETTDMKKNDVRIKHEVGSLAGWIYRNEKPLRTPICRIGRRVLEAMSLSLSPCLRTRRPLPIVCCGKDILVLPMESKLSLT
jgi:hypothetical protein